MLFVTERPSLFKYTRADYQGHQTRHGALVYGSEESYPEIQVLLLVKKNYIVKLTDVWLQKFEGVGQEDYDHVFDAIGDVEKLVYNLKLRFFPLVLSNLVFTMHFPPGSHSLPTSNGLS